MARVKERLSLFRDRLKGSIQLRLSLTLSLAILIVAGAAGTIAFLSALHQAHKLQDSILYQIAGMAQEQPLSAARMLPLRKHDDEAYVVIWPVDPGRPNYHVAKDGYRALPLPNDLGAGEWTLTLGHEDYRVVVRQSSAGQRVAVAQETDFRDRLALGGAFRTVAPFLILIPILVLIVILFIRGMFRPIAALSADVDRRGEQDLEPLAAPHLPGEIRPFTSAINRLLARVSQAMEAQRRFVADAAHELRSPMTALSLQAERLAQAELPPDARDRLGELRLGIERTRKLLTQLLTLARVQATGARQLGTVSVQHAYRQVLEDLMPLADAKGIDIGLTGGQDVEVRVNAFDLTTLVKNLVDNAIRYTPEGGRVDLSVTAGPDSVTLRIADDGPGIAPDERERVFDPFYRTLGSGETGSGLGLAIVRAVADRLAATLRLDYTDAGRQRGLAVFVTFPRR
jgi:two-component system OmpR family sensor kinase